MSRGFTVFLSIIGVIVVLGGVATLIGYAGIRKTVQLKMGDADLAAIADGAYVGTYDCGRFSNSVEVQVADHKIVGVKVIKDQKGSTGAFQKIFDAVIAKQSPAVDAISGATATSKAYLKAIENALQGAR